MLVYNNLKPGLLDKSSCALGMFDGVHLGHKEVIGSAQKMALINNSPCVALSFSTHPQFITARTPTPQLTTLDDRLDLFEKVGVDIAIILDFDKTFSQISAEDYIKDILVGSLNAKSITIGYDHRFGRGKRGNQFLLKELAPAFGYDLQVIPPITMDGQIISSSVIRKLIKYGEVVFANKLLGRQYKLIGTVERGAKRGRELGFPTANVSIKCNLVVPACGVYAVELQIGDSIIKRPAVLNIGFRPTFADRNKPTFEAFILDFDQDIYGQTVSLYFKYRLRDEKKFASAQELVDQINKDVEDVKTNINKDFTSIPMKNINL